jgi:O-antigen/teichoic acid export membrane protein
VEGFFGQSEFCHRFETATKVRNLKRELSQKALYSLLVQVVPLIAGLFLIPVFAREMGAERFSFLSLAWAILGYFSFFDLGVGRTLTKIVAEDPDSLMTREGIGLIGSSCVFVGITSLLATAVSFFLAPWFINSFLHVAADLREELVLSSKILAFGIPFVTLTAALRGLVEGVNDFRSANWIQFLSGIVVFVFPLMGWKLNASMATVSLFLVAGRFLVLGLGILFVLQSLPALKAITWKLKVQKVISVLQHGGWITLGNALSPLMANLDKVLVGGWVELAKLAMYTTPMEVVSRIWIFPAAVSRVVFPKLAQLSRSPKDLKEVFDHGNSLILLMVFPACLILAVFAKEGLTLWLGPSSGEEFVLSATHVAQIISMGIFVNSLNWISYSWLLASRHVRWSVITVLIEIPVFLLSLYFLTHKWGVVGAATAWTLRMVFDFMLTVFVMRRLETGMGVAAKSACVYATVGVPLIGGLSQVPDIQVRGACVIVLLLVFLFLMRSVFKGFFHSPVSSLGQ